MVGLNHHRTFSQVKGLGDECFSVKMEPMASSLSPLIIPGGGLPEFQIKFAEKDGKNHQKLKRGNLIVHFEIELPSLPRNSSRTQDLRSALPGQGEMKLQYFPRQVFTATSAKRGCERTNKCGNV